MNNKILKMVIVLTVTGIFSGGILATVYRVAEPRIEENRLKELKEAIFIVLPDTVDYKEIERNGTVLYMGLDKEGNTTGYAFVSEGPGFQGKIRMMVGLNKDLKHLTGMKVLEQVETPGLGNRIAEEDFQNQFKGLQFEPEIEYVKNKKPEKPNEIQAITGATISSRAVARAITKDVKRVVKILKEEGSGS